MTKEFENKVKELGIVDTKNYSYVYTPFNDHAAILRLPIKNLGTTNAISGWETVKVYRQKGEKKNVQNA